MKIVGDPFCTFCHFIYVGIVDRAWGYWGNPIYCGGGFWIFLSLVTHLWALWWWCPCVGLSSVGVFPVSFIARLLLGVLWVMLFCCGMLDLFRDFRLLCPLSVLKKTLNINLMFVKEISSYTRGAMG